MKKKRKIPRYVAVKSQVGAGGRRFKGKTARSLSVINRSLSRQINIQQVVKNYPVLEIKYGVAININYTNPQHLKWMED